MDNQLPLHQSFLWKRITEGEESMVIRAQLSLTSADIFLIGRYRDPINKRDEAVGWIKFSGLAASQEPYPGLDDIVLAQHYPEFDRIEKTHLATMFVQDHEKKTWFAKYPTWLTAESWFYGYRQFGNRAAEAVPSDEPELCLYLGMLAQQLGQRYVTCNNERDRVFYRAFQRMLWLTVTNDM